VTGKPAFAFGYAVASWTLTGFALVLILLLNLLPALLGGLLVFELIHIIEPPLHKRFPDRRNTLIAVGLLAGVVTLVVVGLVVGFTLLFSSDAGSIPKLLAKLAEIIVNSRATMPEWMAKRIPAESSEIKEMVWEWLRANAAMLQVAGAQTGRGLLYVLLGIIIGAMVALYDALPRPPARNLAAALVQRARRLSTAFGRVVFAQVRISLLNTFFTGIYLAVILPMFGIDLPLKKTLIAVTFMVGLLPVIGNLISNTIIVIVSLSNSLHAAVGSLLFLIVIHKLEYFLNARIIGQRIEARAWELLIAMLVMEAAFGMAGLIAAPIYYAYIKNELAQHGAI
jgi:predicted PurR-regulated permease PerM